MPSCARSLRDREVRARARRRNSMTKLSSRIPTAAKPRSLLNKLSGGVNAMASVRVRRAVPEWQQRRVEREISRCRWMMRDRGKGARGASAARRRDAAPPTLHEAPSMMSPVSLPVSRLAGYAPALPTPFDDDDEVDLSALAYLCDRQIRQGANALVV